MAFEYIFIEIFAIAKMHTPNIPIDAIDVGGMGARRDRSTLYKNISTSPEENEEFKKLLDKKVNVYIQVMPQNKPVSVAEYLK